MADFSCVYLFTLAYTAALIAAHNPPVPARWVGDSSLSCGDPRNVVIAANVTISEINRFKNNFTENKFDAPWDTVDKMIHPELDSLWLEVCDPEGQCLYVLPNITGKSHEPPQTPEEAKKVLVEAVSYSQLYAMALESLFLDQSLYEDVFLNAVDSVHNFVEELVTILVDDALICGLAPDEELIANFSGKAYMGVGRNVRDMRDFVVLRQCLLGMRYIADIFSGGIWN